MVQLDRGLRAPDMRVRGPGGLSIHKRFPGRETGELSGGPPVHGTSALDNSVASQVDGYVWNGSA